MSPSIPIDFDASVTTIAPAANSAWHDTNVMSTALRAVRDSPPLPPLLYLKTHKTGSSTMRNLIYRLGDRRNMSFMMPQPNTNSYILGYPGAFPGEEAALLYGPPKHQFDIICHHAVLNISSMSAYLKPNPYFLTSVRKPTEQMISGHNFHDRGMTWDDDLAKLESGDDPRMLNHQAFDLGWYDFVGGSTYFDHNQTKISEWLTTLDKALNSTVILEYFDEGLALLRQKTHIDIEELTYVREKVQEEKVFPTKDQRQRLESLAPVDRALYAHLNQSFWREWFSGNVPQLEADVVTIRRLHQEMQLVCDEGDRKRCPNLFMMTEHEATVYLKSKQSVLW